MSVTMVRKIATALATIIFLSFLSQTCMARDAILAQAPTDSTYNKLYQKGMKLVGDHPKQALNTWLSAKDFGKAPDPRIGIHFVETVTQHEMKQFYDQASEMYFWGISGTRIKPYHDALLDELQGLEPLMSRDRYKQLRHLLDDGDPRFYKELRVFWQSRDPMPSTPRNEYLITIWQRIHYAKKHFTKASYSAYGTDARGPVYVKFGKPDRHYQNQEIDLNIKSRDIGNAFNVPTSVASSQHLFRLNPTSPDILFWIYDKKTVRASQRVIYMFGTISKTQPRYGIIKSLDELIPRSLNRNAGAYHDAVIKFRRRIYREYKNIDPFFSRELALMKIPGSKGNTRSYIASNKARTTSNLEARQANAEPVTRPSTIPDFKSNIKTYHFVDAGRQPYSVAVMYSFPVKLLAANQYNEAISGSGSKKVINHTLQVIGPDDNSLQTYRDVPKMELSSQVIGDHAFPVVSVFKLSHVPNDAQLRGTAELIAYNRHKKKQDKVSFLGLHDDSQDFKSPDTPSDTHWQISDPVVGYKNNDIRLKANPFPFYPAPQNIIPQGKNVNLYFELYDFSPDADHQKPYRVSYSIENKKGFLGSIFSGDNGQKVTIKQKKSSSIEPNNIEIETSKLPPDDYTLHFTVVNSANDRKIEKKVQFKVK